MVERSIPLDVLSGSRATKELEKTVLELSASSNQQTKHVIKLTYTILILTFIMACMVGVQIWLALQTPNTISQSVIQPIAAQSNSPSIIKVELSHSEKENSVPSPLPTQSKKD